MPQTHVQTPAQTPAQAHVQGPAQAPAQTPIQPRRPEVLRGRIGTGFSPEPHRYRLYVAADDCPSCLGVTAAFADLGLRDTVALTVLRPGSDPAGHEALRRAYEAAGHDHDGTLTVPALCDGWSGRVVSNHAPDILEDLRRLSVHPAFRPGR
ncbi:hypothetical protein OG730_33715 [Streptomyces sp. NBC_01298]|uniref:hypothetical protein n=1 Tax=Streptomyces sp. NBC_01298 TaxID=2903817 RepID=UPI002E12D985|nr:hypothetical protein OG730_33715 [Streptomyces sp. NBC_01298]